MWPGQAVHRSVVGNCCIQSLALITLCVSGYLGYTSGFSLSCMVFFLIAVCLLTSSKKHFTWNENCFICLPSSHPSMAFMFLFFPPHINHWQVVLIIIKTLLWTFCIIQLLVLLISLFVCSRQTVSLCIRWYISIPVGGKKWLSFEESH